MKIKNEIVTIKIGKKQYDFNNMILDEYLERFSRAQLNQNDINKIVNDKKLRYCLIKFDLPFENLRGDTELHNQDFDICFLDSATIVQSVNDNQVSIQYSYRTSENTRIWDYKKNTSQDINISDYHNKRITAIGFNSLWSNDSSSSIKIPVCAVLDTSNYNIFLQENQDFSVTRKDIILTDGIFYTTDKTKVPAPAHICPDGIPSIIKQIYDSSIYHGYGILYSIGLSSYLDYIDKEFIIGEDVEAVLNGNEIDINGLENYFQNNPLFCGENIFASSEIYPKQSNYKYIIFKYKVWQNDEEQSAIVDTNYFYYQAVPITQYGNTNLKIKYERG